MAFAPSSSRTGAGGGGNGATSVGSESSTAGGTADEASELFWTSGGRRSRSKVVPHKPHRFSSGGMSWPQIGHSRVGRSENCTVGSSAIRTSLHIHRTQEVITHRSPHSSWGRAFSTFGSGTLTEPWEKSSAPASTALVVGEESSAATVFD